MVIINSKESEIIFKCVITEKWSGNISQGFMFQLYGHRGIATLTSGGATAMEYHAAGRQKLSYELLRQQLPD